MNKYYVDCVANLYAQHPVVVFNGKIIAKRFKGHLYDDAHARAVRLAELLNMRKGKA